MNHTSLRTEKIIWRLCTPITVPFTFELRILFLITGPHLTLFSHVLKVDSTFITCS